MENKNLVLAIDNDGNLTCASLAFIQLLREVAGPRGGYLHDAVKYNVFCDQKSDAALVLFSQKTVDLFRAHLHQVPGGKGTLLYIIMVQSMIEPIFDTEFGTPFEVITSMRRGLHILRMFRASVNQTLGLNLSDNFVSREMYDTFELMVQQSENFFVIAFLHHDIPWRRKALLRRVDDTRPCEGFNSYNRVCFNSVNFTSEGLLRNLPRYRNSADAKAAMELMGVKVAHPKGKAKAYAEAMGGPSKVDWDEFEQQMRQLIAEHGPDAWKEFQRLAMAAITRGKELGQLLINDLVPEMAVETFEPTKQDFPEWLDNPGLKGADDESLISMPSFDSETGEIKGRYPKHPRDSTYPWDPEEEARLKAIREDRLGAAGYAGRYGSSDKGLPQRPVPPSQVVSTVIYVLNTTSPQPCTVLEVINGIALFEITVECAVGMEALLNWEQAKDTENPLMKILERVMHDDAPEDRIVWLGRDGAVAVADETFHVDAAAPGAADPGAEADTIGRYVVVMNLEVLGTPWEAEARGLPGSEDLPVELFYHFGQQFRVAVLEHLPDDESRIVAAPAGASTAHDDVFTVDKPSAHEWERRIDWAPSQFLVGRIIGYRNQNQYSACLVEVQLDDAAGTTEQYWIPCPETPAHDDAGPGDGRGAVAEMETEAEGSDGVEGTLGVGNATGDKNAVKFGVVGGEFYLNHNSRPIPVATALKLCQRKVKRPSTDRSKRNVTDTKQSRVGSLNNCAYYAVAFGTGLMEHLLFRIAKIVELVHRPAGSKKSNIESCEFSDTNKYLRFNYCDLHGDGSIVLSKDHTELLHLSIILRQKIIMRLNVDDDGTSSASAVKIGPGMLDRLRGNGRVDYTAENEIREIQVPGSRRSNAAPLTLSDYGCQVTSMKRNLATLGLQEGDVLLEVNCERCEGPRDAQRILRDVFADKKRAVSLKVWQPPPDMDLFVDAGGTEDGVPEGGNFDALVSAALQLTEESRTNMKRLVCRLEGGDKAENVKRICRALAIQPKQKPWNLAAIEVTLRKLEFRQYEAFRPTAHHMTLGHEEFYKAIRVRELPNYPGEFEYVQYSIRQMEACLVEFVQQASA